jgi:hypothetical protein
MRGAVTPKQTVVGGFKGSEEGGWVVFWWVGRVGDCG